MANKKKKTIIIITILLAFISLISLGIKHYYYEPTNYLVRKYDFKRSEIKPLYYLPRVLINNSNHSPMPIEFYFTNEKWCYKYNGRIFYVEKYKSVFCDDYQLEDISRWCQEYLAQNIDENIKEFIVDSEYMHSNEYTNNFTTYNKILTKDDVAEFINSHCDYRQIIYKISDDEFDKLSNCNQTEIYIYKNNIEEKLVPKLRGNNIKEHNILVYLVKDDNYKMIRHNVYSGNGCVNSTYEPIQIAIEPYILLFEDIISGIKRTLN